MSLNYTPWLRKLVNDIFLADLSAYYKIGSSDNESCTQFEIRGQESGILAAVIAHLSAYVGNIPTPRPLAFVAPDDGIGGIIQGRAA